MRRVNQSKRELAMEFWVYILKCADDSYYVGHTDNLEVRLYQHHQGYFNSCYTFKRRPLELLFAETLPSRQEALERERQIKGWSRRKKLALIEQRWEDLVRYSKRKSIEKI